MDRGGDMELVGERSPGRERWLQVVGVMLAAGGVLAQAACAGPSVALPDPQNSAVVEEADRVAGIYRQGAEGRPPAHCQVRVLRMVEDTTWASVRCTALSGPVDTREGWLTVTRVEGDRVTEPRDGAEYTRSVEAMMPADLAELVLDGDREDWVPAG